MLQLLLRGQVPTSVGSFGSYSKKSSSIHRTQKQQNEQAFSCCIHSGSHLSATSKRAYYVTAGGYEMAEHKHRSKSTGQVEKVMQNNYQVTKYNIFLCFSPSPSICSSFFSLPSNIGMSLPPGFALNFNVLAGWALGILRLV